MAEISLPRGQYLHHHMPVRLCHKRQKLRVKVSWQHIPVAGHSIRPALVRLCHAARGSLWIGTGSFLPARLSHVVVAMDMTSWPNALCCSFLTSFQQQTRGAS